MISKLKDKALYLVIILSVLITSGILISIIGFIFVNGIGHVNLKFITSNFDSETQYVEIISDLNRSENNNPLYVNTLGITIGEKEDGSIIVTNIEKKSPVKKAKNKVGEVFSLKKGDEIVKINGEQLEGKTALDVVNLINSQNVDVNTIKVTREGEGVFPMIITTLMIIVLSILIATPIGILAAIYLVEYAKQGKIVKLIRFATETLAGIPSIIYGLFGMLFFVTILNFNYSILAGALTLSIILLPTIIRTTEETLLTVPDSYREGSLGLGATKLETIAKIIIPSSIPGILVAIILSIGRIVGESAALLLTAGTAAKIPKSVFSSGATLTIKAYTLAKEEGNIEMACAIGTIIIILILVLNTSSKLITKKYNNKV